MFKDKFSRIVVGTVCLASTGVQAGSATRLQDLLSYTYSSVANFLLETIPNFFLRWLFFVETNRKTEPVLNIYKMVKDELKGFGEFFESNKEFSFTSNLRTVLSHSHKGNLDEKKFLYAGESLLDLNIVRIDIEGNQAIIKYLRKSSFCDVIYTIDNVVTYDIGNNIDLEKFKEFLKNLRNSMLAIKELISLVEKGFLEFEKVEKAEKDAMSKKGYRHSPGFFFLRPKKEVEITFEGKFLDRVEVVNFSSVQLSFRSSYKQKRKYPCIKKFDISPNAGGEGFVFDKPKKAQDFIDLIGKNVQLYSTDVIFPRK